MSEQMPSREGASRRSNESSNNREASNPPVDARSRSQEVSQAIRNTRESLSQHANKTPAVTAEVSSSALAHAEHHHDSPMKARAKLLFGWLLLPFYLGWQGIKKASGMAGKGGGHSAPAHAPAKKDDHGHGGGH